MKIIVQIVCGKMNFPILLVLLALLTTLDFGAKASKNTGEEGLNCVSHLLELQDCASAVTVLDTLTFDDNTAPHYFYFRGVAEDMCGNKHMAEFYLEKCLYEFDKYDYKDETYLDASLRLIDFCRSNDNSSQRMAELAKNALSAPKEILDNYSNTYAIYECYVKTLNDLWKTSEVERIVKEGLPYVEKSLNPTNQEYYHLRYMEIVALILMNRWDRAESRLADMNRINCEL